MRKHCICVLVLLQQPTRADRPAIMINVREIIGFSIGVLLGDDRPSGAAAQMT